MKVLNILFIILFIFSAAVQYNDPDPYIWIPVYLYGALLCYSALKRRYNPALYTIGLAVYSLYALYLFFNEEGVLDWIKEHNAENIAQSMKTTKPWIEETREFFGLLLLIIALTINRIWLSRTKRSLVKASLLTIGLVIPGITFGQDISQTVRGTLQAVSGMPVHGAAVTLYNSTQSVTALSDTGGSFRFPAIPAGRYNVKVQHPGYKQTLIEGLAVNAGKQPVLEINLEEAVVELGEVPVHYKGSSGLSDKVITVEETQRFAATFNDPARLAASFAGVITANDQANHIIIRGNSPNSLAWNIEGAEIVNPNHLDNAGTYTDRMAYSGGGVNILSAQLLADSRLMTGSYLPGLGNTVAGIFDMRLRKGNNESREFTGQLSLIGTDLAVEGPLKKGASSYLFNYRYSTIGLLSELGVNFGGESTSFQDFSFNFSFPTHKAGSFTVFGIGGKSLTTFTALRDTAEWVFKKDRQDIGFSSTTGILGATYRYLVTPRTFLKFVIAASSKESDREADFLLNDYSAARIETDQYLQQKIAGSVSIQHTAGKSFFTTGSNITHYYFNLFSAGSSSPDKTDVNGRGGYGLFQPYVNWRYLLKDNIVMNSGLHSMYFTLNDQFVLEPRSSFRWELKGNQYFTLKYGLYSQMQLPYLYFISSPAQDNLHFNKSLGFTRSHQSSLSYSASTDRLSYNAEAYYQYLFHVPVSNQPGSSFSALNILDEIVSETLVNEGTGKNYGIEITAKKPFFNRAYFLIAGSVYESKYTPADGIERDTRFNGNYAVSFSGGKEVPWTKNGKNRTLGLNMRSVYRGGLRETPIHESRSQLAGETIFEESNPFSIKQENYFRLDIRISLKKHKARYTRTLALDIQNLTSRQNIAFRYYDPQKKEIVTRYQLGIIPILSYRIEFRERDK